MGREAGEGRRRLPPHGVDGRATTGGGLIASGGTGGRNRYGRTMGDGCAVMSEGIPARRSGGRRRPAGSGLGGRHKVGAKFIVVKVEVSGMNWIEGMGSLWRLLPVVVLDLVQALVRGLVLLALVPALVLVLMLFVELWKRLRVVMVIMLAALEWVRGRAWFVVFQPSAGLGWLMR